MPLQVKVNGGRHDGRLLEVDDVTLMFLDTFMAFVSGGAECAFSHFEYEDDEGDRIAVRNDDDLQVMISQAGDIGDVISVWLKSPTNSVGNVQLLMDELNSITPEDLQHLSVLSQGQFGTVYKSLDVRNDRIIAVKCVSIDGSVETQKSIVAEIGILKQCCGSPFIVDFYGAAIIDSELCICLELMDGRSMETYGKLPRAVLFPVCVSVLCGLEFLWTHHVMHRDVKPCNFLVNSKGQVKLSDFGVSKQLDRSVAQSYVGTNAYMAPERIFGGEYRICSDVWSYGLSIAEMAIGRFPLARTEGQSVDSVIQSILLGDYEVTLKMVQAELKEHSEEFMHFTLSCLKREISERASAEQLVGGVFVQQNLPIDTITVASFVRGMKNLKLSLVQQCVDAPVCSTIKDAHSYCVDPESSSHFVILDELVLGFNRNYEKIHEISWSAQCPDEKVVAFDFLSDETVLCAVLKSGVVLTARPGEDEYMMEVAQCVVDLDSCVTAAQWSPDFSTLCITTTSNIIFLSRDFDVITQDELNPSRQGSAELMTVGWGSRETQFQGKVGRKGLQAPDAESIPVQLDPTKDDFAPSISWQSGGEYVAVNSVDAVEDKHVRVIRIWNREGELISRCVPLAGMESCLATRPVGNLIATARRLNDKRSVCFYEKNGQRRYQFDLPRSRERHSADVKIEYLAWNADASILAAYFVSESAKQFWIDFYVVSNYKWDLKFVHQCSGPLTNIFWNTEKAEKIHLLSSSGEVVCLSFETAYDYEDLVVIAVDGCESRVTDFNKGTVPPPMSHSTFSTESEIVEIAGGFGLHAVLLADSTLLICKKNSTEGVGKLAIISKFSLPKNGLYYNLQLNSENSVSAISCDDCYTVLKFDFSSGELKEKVLYDSNTPLVWHKITESSQLIVQESDGEWIQITEGRRESFILKRSRSGWSRKCIWVESGKGLIELNRDHELTWNGNVLAANVGSFSVGTNFLLFITLEYQIKAVELSCLASLEPHRIASISGRAVERGATLVCHEKGGTRVWMQMPRGNLELIHHRTLLIHKLKKLLDAHDYATATAEMRRQRVDMNLLYDHAPSDFLEHVEDYINAVDDADFINIFVLNLQHEDCTVTVYADSYPGRKAKNDIKLLRVCQKLRQIILNIQDVERKHKLFTVALSCFVQESHGLIVEALTELRNTALAAGDSGLELQKKWLLHMSYMVDAKLLFQHALATYDLGIALLIAENSEWDPKEYLPLLNGFRAYKPAAYMKYQIDLHLQSFESALKHLATIEDRFEECLGFIKQHSLYQQSLLIFKEHAKWRDVYLLYADYLVSRRLHKDAMLLYSKCEAPEKILECYVNLNDYKSFTKLADKMNLAMAERVPKLLKMASALEKTSSWVDLAAVYRCLGTEKYSKNILESLFKGFQWTVALQEFRDTHEKEIFEAVENRAHSVEASVTIWRQSLDQHSRRLKEVVANKKELFGEWLTGERDVDNDAQSEVFSEASSIISKSSKLSRMSTASARRRKQIDRKKRSLKQGGQYEDCALLAAIKDIYSAIDDQQDEMCQLLPALVECTCLDYAIYLQKELTFLIDNATRLAQTIWPSYISFENLPGPIHEICRGEDGVIRLPPDGFLPQRMVIEPELVRPVIRQNIDWKLDILK